MSRNRGSRMPQALHHKCPTCAAPPMEWCWSEEMLPKGSKPNGFVCPRPDMELHYSQAPFLHAERRRIKGSRHLVRRSPGPHDSLIAQVYFKGHGPKKIDVIKVLRAFLNIGLRQAKEMSESGPSVIAEAPKERATAFARALKEKGAEVEVRGRGNG